MVLGCSGGGKSTLAAKLAAILKLRPGHIDLIYWLPNWVERDKKTGTEMILAEIKADGWVFDGNSRTSYEARVAKSDMIVWVDIARWRCIYNVCYRVLKYRGKTRPDMADGCAEKVDFEFLHYIWTFKYQRGKAIAALLEKYKHEKQTIRLTNYAEINAFVEKMKQNYG